MAQAFLHGNGGANPLNFRVVGGAAAPANPRENTIWVNTDTPVTNYIFSKEDPNLLDLQTWASEVNVVHGTKTYTKNSITLTATENDCYTDYYSSNTAAYRFPVVPGKTYVLSWEHTGSSGHVYLFPNGSGTGLVNTNSSSKKLELTAASGVTFVTFRVGVSTANKSATYSDITFCEKGVEVRPGTVLIETGTYSDASFNALKKNSIRVYPLLAKQYINGSWTDKSAQSYRGGTWVGWIPYLYNTGDECDSLTGGWVSKEWTYSSGVNTSAGTQTIQRNADSIQFVKEGLKGGAFHTANKIDLNGVKTIKFEGSMPVESSGDEWHMIFGVWSDLNGSYAYDSAVAKIATTSSGRTSFSLDVSSLNGTYYVGFAKYDAGTITMKKLYLER